MPDISPTWTTAGLHAASLLGSFAAMAWLALGMDTHWAQVRPERPHSALIARRLRARGVLALATSLALCLLADHPSMAALVWPMALAGAALCVALLLAWRPRWLRPLTRWA